MELQMGTMTVPQSSPIMLFSFLPINFSNGGISKIRVFARENEYYVHSDNVKRL